MTALTLARSARTRAFDGVLGMNARNDRIARDNPFASVRLVNDKAATKSALRTAGAPTSPTLALLTTRRELRALDWDALPPAWALKPNQGLGGSGILLAAGRSDDGSGWVTASGRSFGLTEVEDHVREVLDGEFSSRGRDCALLEPLIRAHPDMERLSYRGLPDVRVLCLSDQPVLAMVRLPTRSSGGRANLHQGAIGAAVDLSTGRLTRAWTGRSTVTHHPDSGAIVVGAQIPHWDAVLDAASTCGPATGLRYVGADVVVDAEVGPLVLEVNARPGLQIQNVTGVGLLDAASAAA
jgi:alpha-L-glutamate ligase-like protein